MVGPAHLQNILVAGFEARNPGAHHAGLGAGPQHAEHLNRREAVGNLLRQLVLPLGEKARRRPAGVQEVDDRIPHHRVIRTQNRGPAGLQEVVIPVPVGVVELGPLGLVNHNREGIVEGQIVLHPARNDLLCLRDHRLGLLALLLKIIVHIILHRVGPHPVNGLLDQLVQLPRHLVRIEIIIPVNRVSVVCHVFFLSYD